MIYGNYKYWILPYMPLVFMVPFVYGLLLEVRRKVWMVYNFTTCEYYNLH